MYTAEQFDTKAYRVTTEFDGEEISFNVIVANDGSELPELVEFHLNYLRNPNTAIAPQEPVKTTDMILQEQQAIITDLKAELDTVKAEVTALKGTA